MKKQMKLLSLFLVVCMMFTGFEFGILANKADAICCRKDNFDKSRYTLTGNMAHDVAMIAKSQKGRTCNDFGYSGDDYAAWCDEYVADCLENAGADSSIVAHGGDVADFKKQMLNRGALPVSSPQEGDLVFFTNGSKLCHVEIVTKVENGTVYCAGGNNGNRPGFCRGEKTLSSYLANSPGRSVSCYLRPNYSNNGDHLNPDIYSVPTRDLYYKSPVMTGRDVGWVQAVLYQLDYSIDVDLSFGPKTKETVAKFQRDNGLTADGKVDSTTRAKLKTLWERTKSGVSAPTWAKITGDAKTVKKGDTITLTPSSDSATKYTIGIEKYNSANERYESV